MSTADYFKKIFLLLLFVFSLNSFEKEPKLNKEQMRHAVAIDSKSAKHIWVIYPIIITLLFYSYKKEFAK